jgi:hypothetical protein
VIAFRDEGWLHELSPQELQITGLVTIDAVADLLPDGSVTDSAVASLTLKSVQDALSTVRATGRSARARIHQNGQRRLADRRRGQRFYASLRPSLCPCTALEGGVRNASKRSFTMA